jgi:hypothetical protein
MLIYKDEALSEIPYISHGFFGRTGGVSDGGYTSLNASLSTDDSPININKNKTLISNALGVQEISMCKQVHGADVLNVSMTMDEAQMQEADAMVSKTHGCNLGIKTADCVPVLFASMKAPIIGAAHAGWGGAFKGVAQNTIDHMCGLGAQEQDIVCAIGPSIHQKSYEVDEGFKQKFLNQSAENEGFFIPSKNDGRYMFALPEYVAARIKAHSPHIQHISLAPYDTYEHEDLFFSHRRASHARDTNIGRQLSVIGLLP